MDNSGASGIVMIIADNMVYLGSTGNNKGILSIGQVKKVISLNEEHTPYNQSEYERVKRGGARVTYQNSKLVVYPGQMQVTRSFGNIFAKLQQYGAIPDIIINDPHLKHFTIHHNYDFILLSSIFYPLFYRSGNLPQTTPHPNYQHPNTPSPRQPTTCPCQCRP